VTALEGLARLQDMDTRLEQIRHRREHLPERAELAGVQGEIGQWDRRRAGVAEQRHELEREQKRLEDEVAAVEGKAVRENDRLYSGSVTAPKELEALQAEVTSLRSRQSVLEDHLLEVMEAAEPLDAELGQIDTERLRLAEESARLEAVIAAAEVEIDAEAATAAAEREAHVAAIDPELLAEYDARRRRSGGVAVGRLQHGTCSACSLALSAVDVDRLARLPSDEVADCPECGVILVRGSADGRDRGPSGPAEGQERSEISGSKTPGSAERPR
jgi:predicted  nucleic acid-binding Zn-ribbon protein